MAESDREIERKFLPDRPPEGLDDLPRTKIRQGYIAITEAGTEVRIRKEGRRGLLTVKDGHGESRGQVEIQITPAQFASLWPLTKGRRIRKVRYEVPYEGLTVQVDVYRRRLKGLLTAEVEFPDEESAGRFEAPAWLGREVTGDEHFSNQNLARHGLPQGSGRRGEG
jgi:CYTH domain-containing protein